MEECSQEVFTFYLPQNTPFKTVSLLILGYVIQQQQRTTLSLGIFDVLHSGHNGWSLRLSEISSLSYTTEE